MLFRRLERAKRSLRQADLRRTEGRFQRAQKQKKPLIFGGYHQNQELFLVQSVAEGVGFEPTCPEGKRFSRPPRYDHFDNPPIYMSF